MKIQNLTKIVNFRVTEKEAIYLKRAARDAGYRLSEYVRSAAFNRASQEYGPSQPKKEAVR